MNLNVLGAVRSVLDRSVGHGHAGTAAAIAAVEAGSPELAPLAAAAAGDSRLAAALQGAVDAANAAVGVALPPLSPVAGAASALEHGAIAQLRPPAGPPPPPVARTTPPAATPGLDVLRL